MTDKGRSYTQEEKEGRKMEKGRRKKEVLHEMKEENGRTKNEGVMESEESYS